MEQELRGENVLGGGGKGEGEGGEEMGDLEAQLAAWGK